jgi:ribosomal protein L11 methyltransferase
MNYEQAPDPEGTVTAQLETGGQTASRIAALVTESLAAEDVAVSLSAASAGRSQVVIYFRTPPDENVVRALVAAAAGAEVAAELRFARVAEEDWVGASLAGLAPVTAGRFVVHGAHDRAGVAVNRIGIEIEAALAFGTGHHGTTRGCLLALDRVCRLQSARHGAPRVLDLGTGSGVLAIAAARVLQRRVLATDIDPVAVRVARTNARLNRAGGLVEIIRADGVAARRLRECAPFDLIIANILLGPLLRLAAPLKKLAAPGARIVLSGLLAAQANAVIAAYRPLALERRIDLDGWTTLVLVRRARRRRAVAACRRSP